jgi:hypothetical protein
MQNSRYQLPNTIAGAPIADTRTSIHRIDPLIGQQIRSQDSAPQVTDARRLLQLALVLALAYVLFLAGWFWKTRARPQSVGRVVRF